MFEFDEGAETHGAIARAWDEEIARRVADMEAGRTEWVPADEVMARLHNKIKTSSSQS